METNKGLSGEYPKIWDEGDYTFFYNVTLTGLERYADFTFVATVQKKGCPKYGKHSEVTKELLNDPNFDTYAKAIVKAVVVEYEQRLKSIVNE